MKRRTKKGPRVGFDELWQLLANECGNRCLDDDEDTEEVIKALLRDFRIYKKVKVQCTDSEIK